MDDGNWMIRSQDTIIEITLESGMPVISSVRAAEGWHDWMPRTPETILPKRLEILGRIRRTRWTCMGILASETEIKITYRCEETAAELVSIWRTAGLPGPIEHTLTLTNHGQDKILLNPVPTIGITLRPERGHQLQNWWVEKGAGYVSDEGVHVDQVVPDYSRSLLSGTYCMEGLRREAIPWFSIHDSSSKHGVYGGVEFSGWTKISVKRLCDGSVSAEMGLYDRDGLTVHQVMPGETLEFPTCFIGSYIGEVEDGCNRLHTWVQKHLLPPAVNRTTPMLVNNSWGSGMAVTEDLARRMIDDCVDLGIELYHVDAGWYNEVGDWHTHPEKLPCGLEAIADYAHSKGLAFGLWVGWTQGGSKRDGGDDVLSVFNPKQRGWFGMDYPEDWQCWDFTGKTVCLGSKEAREWCLRELKRMVKQYKLDLLEHDQEIIIDHCIRGDHDHRREEPVDVSRAVAEGYYWVYDRLKEEFPDLLLENCVNGGRIVDFGIARRTHYVCSTDLYDPLSLRRTFYDSSYPLPPSTIELYIEDQEYESSAHFDFVIRSSMLGWCTIMIDTTAWNAEQHEAAKRNFITYKERLRPLIAHGDVYHVLPRPDGKLWDGIEYYDPDTGRGVLLVFRPDNDEPIHRVMLRGLDPDRKYRIESTDGSVSTVSLKGCELLQSGLAVSLPQRNSSDLIFLEIE